jgi:hypothetical protein
MSFDSASQTLPRRYSGWRSWGMHTHPPVPHPNTGVMAPPTLTVVKEGPNCEARALHSTAHTPHSLSVNTCTCIPSWCLTREQHVLDCPHVVLLPPPGRHRVVGGHACELGPRVCTGSGRQLGHGCTVVQPVGDPASTTGEEEAPRGVRGSGVREFVCRGWGGGVGWGGGLIYRRLLVKPDRNVNTVHACMRACVHVRM